MGVEKINDQFILTLAQGDGSTATSRRDDVISICSKNAERPWRDFSVGLPRRANNDICKIRARHTIDSATQKRIGFELIWQNLVAVDKSSVITDPLSSAANPRIFIEVV